MTKAELYQKACMLPLLPGVYIIRDKADEIIYIGKAKRLRIRVSQYFREGVPHDNKVSQMIALYCKKQHHTKQGLCPDCAALDAYARQRSDRCPFMETKTFCSNCKVHCYKPEMREKIRQVMRFSGPRMLFHHPIAAIRHVMETNKEKKRLEEPP